MPGLVAERLVELTEGEPTTVNDLALAEAARFATKPSTTTVMIIEMTAPKLLSWEAVPFGSAEYQANIQGANKSVGTAKNMMLGTKMRNLLSVSLLTQGIIA